MKDKNPFCDDSAATSWVDRPGAFYRRRVLIWSLIVIIYLLGVSPMWWPTSDSALYMSLSHSLAEGRGFVYNGQRHTLVTPGLPLVLAGLERAFGPGYFAGNMFVALCGLGAAAMVFLTIRRLSDDSIAITTAIVTALSYPFFSNSHRILTQIPFALVFWCMFYASLRRRTGSAWWLAVVGVLSLLGIVIRAPGLLLVGPMGVGLFFNGDRTGRAGPLRWCSVAMLGPMFLIATVMFGVSWAASGSLPGYLDYAFSVLGGGIGQRLADIGQAAALVPDVLTRLLTGHRGLMPLGLLAGGVIIVGMTHLWSSSQRYIVIFVALALAAYLMMGRDIMGTRYFLTLMPIYIYAFLQGLCICVRRVCRRLGRQCDGRTYLKAITIFAVICIACHIPKVLRNATYYSYAAWTQPDNYYQVTRKKKYVDMFAIAEAMTGGGHPPGKTGGPRDGEGIIHHLSGRIVAPYTTGKQEQWSAPDAERIIEFVGSHPEIRFFVFDVAHRGKAAAVEFFDIFDPWLDAAKTSGSLQPLYEGRYYAAYARRGAETSTSAPRQEQ
ncbi:MAG: glycosyltransferase family 39 protein [bacterium]|nr:glycosyltransferase family 39 protein [bacterium]